MTKAERPPHILILAAGASSRMAPRDKLLERIDGETLLRRITRAAVATGVPVLVALPPDRPARRDAIADLPLTLGVVPDPQNGMAASLKHGLSVLPPEAPVMVVLADLPEITADDLNHMLISWQAAPDAILRATADDGTPGHPVCFPVWARAELEGLRGDEGAREFLKRHVSKTRLVALPGQHATTDLDTDEDWVRWRIRREGQD